MVASPEFQDQVIDLLPRMRGWARRLTRDAAAADDLVQDVALKALAACESFTPGTNFPAWVRRIMANHFIAGVRRRRETGSLEDLPEASVAAAQQDRATLRELGLAFHGLPREQRDALHSIAIQERSYEELAASTGLAVGTLKSRVHRARARLRARMRHGASAAA